MGLGSSMSRVDHTRTSAAVKVLECGDDEEQGCQQQLPRRHLQHWRGGHKATDVLVASTSGSDRAPRSMLPTRQVPAKSDATSSTDAASATCACVCTQKPLVRGRMRGAVSDAPSCAALSAAARAAGLVSAAKWRTVTICVTTATDTCRQTAAELFRGYGRFAQSAALVVKDYLQMLERRRQAHCSQRRFIEAGQATGQPCTQYKAHLGSNQAGKSLAVWTPGRGPSNFSTSGTSMGQHTPAA